MIVDTRVFDGTDAGLFALFEWAGQCFPAHHRTDDGEGIARVAVAHPGSDMIQWTEPGDTIERHDDGLLVVMPAGIAERTVHIRPRDMI